MPPLELKGIKGLYEECCDGSFYEWVFPKSEYDPPPIANEKHICTAPIWFNDAEALTLIEDKYDSNDELNSTWKLSPFSVRTKDDRKTHRPYKTFQLESGDELVVVKCKTRPVLLIKKVSSDWRIPGNTSKLFNTWLCLPLFSYKHRHRQEYVFTDQALKRPHHFYFPPGAPGLDYESTGKLIEIQFIPEKNLSPMKKMCEVREPKMGRPFCVSDKAFQVILGHIANFLPGSEISGECKEWHDFFVELVQEEVDKIVK